VHGAQYLRFVLFNEPAERLREMGDKVRAAALGA